MHASGLECVFVFICAPAREVLKQRLIARGDMTPEDIEKRLTIAEAEEKAARDAGFFSKFLVNRNKEKYLEEGSKFVAECYLLK